jgi:phosphohistidine phosphatase
MYLVQHAEAKSEDEDPQRSLTEKGHRDALAVADMAKRLDLKVKQIRHSGKTRARQTAEVMGAALNPSDGVVEVDGLSPLDDVVPIAGPVAKALTEAGEPVMLVGHLPFMERLAGQMTTGDAEQAVVKFHNAGIVCLTHAEDNRWQVSWIITPEICGFVI